MDKGNCTDRLIRPLSSSFYPFPISATRYTPFTPLAGELILMLNAQDLLTLMAEALITGAAALYGSLFVHGLIMRHRRPIQSVQSAQPVQTIQPVQVAESALPTAQPAEVDAVDDLIVALPLPLVQEVVQEVTDPDKGTAELSFKPRKRAPRRQRSLASARTSSR